MTMNTPSPSKGGTSRPLKENTIARIALACAGVSGDPTVATGIETLGGPVAFVAAIHDGRDHAAALSNLVRQRIRCFATASRVAAVLQSMRRNWVCALTPSHGQWPTQVGSLGRRAPLVLFTKGDATLLRLPSIAFAGNPSPTSEAIHMTIELATGLADRQWVITAGLGQGIAQLALRSATAMQGRTIRLAAMGLHDIFVVEGSVAISELPPTNTVTVRGQRRAKNLLAAISTKTIIVEAGAHSGALRTAQAAHEMNRPVGVVAGANGNTSAGGCGLLLERHSLALVSSITDADRLR